MIEKDREAEYLIKEHKSFNYEKNVESLNYSNKELNLFIGEKQEKVEGIDFPEKFTDYGQIPNLIKDNLKTMGLETLTPIQKLFFGYLFNYKNMFFDKNKTDNNYKPNKKCFKIWLYFIPINFSNNTNKGISNSNI